MYSIYPPESNHTHDWNSYVVTIPDFLSQEDLDKIEDNASNIEAEESTVSSDNQKSDYRTCEIKWFHPNESTEWLFQKMTGLLQEMNGMHYLFNLSSWEPFQHTTYHGHNGGEFKAHLDEAKVFNQSNNIRKLSYSIMLNDPSEYEGGDLKIWYGKMDEEGKPALKIENLKVGSLVAFPSFLLHEVTPVTEGTRKSLVCWTRGPRWS